MSHGRIAVLDGLVADQIAAGEVVERPGSVVKELIENSLDAKATRIQLDIDGGGTRRLRVLDNGVGLPEDQVELAFKRHATSKIQRLSDLDGVTSFGFRGEALPSIASVSKITMRTRQEDQVAGQSLKIEGGKIKEHREVGCPVGTDIEVSDLFYNTPARLKFLKRESTEASHASEALVRLAAIRPEVAFAMKSGGRRIRDLPRVDSVEQRVAYMFAKETLARAEGSHDGLEVLAILGPPERARAGAGSLYTYVNGRFMRDKILLRAVTQAFGGTLEPGRYPVGLLALTLPFGSVDVNVHPQKTEIRFADANAVYRAVQRVVGEMVARAVWALGTPGLSKIAEPNIHHPKDPPAPPIPSGRLVPPPSMPNIKTRQKAKSTPPKHDVEIGTTGNRDTTPKRETERPLPNLYQSAPEPEGQSRFLDLDYIGQAKGLFLLFEGKDELVIIDQHAAHERVTFERLRAQLKQGRLTAQRLLVPHLVDLGPEDTDRIAGLLPNLDRLGLEASQSGPDRIAIHAVPAALKDASPDRLLADMVLAIEEGREGSRGDLEDHVLSTMACHSSLRSGRTVNPSEVEALQKEMDTIDFAGHCPHGRPVLARIPWHEIRRRVGRG